MKTPEPANDNSASWRPGDYRTVCACDSVSFNLLWREGLHYIVCARCGADHTMTTIWGKQL